MCKALQVSRSGYYKSLKSAGRKKRGYIYTVLVRSIFAGSNRNYGILKITRAIRKLGYKCNRKRVARIMKQEGLKPKVVKKFRVTTDSRHNRPVAPNILNQNFKVDSPNKVWLSDLTYIPTYEGWLYLCVIMDLATRRAISYAADKYLSSFLVTKAFRKAVLLRRNPKEVIFHSDRGIQYASDQFRTLLNEHEFIQSMSRKGNCYDNAPMESFFHILKSELVNCKKYRTREEAATDIFHYIEYFYNTKRIHSSINYLSPVEYEKLFI